VEKQQKMRKWDVLRLLAARQHSPKHGEELGAHMQEDHLKY